MDSNNMLHHGQEVERSFEVTEWEKELEEAEQRGYENGVSDEKKRVAKEKRKHNKQKREAFMLFLLLAVITLVAWGAYTVVSGHIKLAGDGWFWGWLAGLGACIFKACTGDKELSEDTRGNMGVFQSFLCGIQEFSKDIRKNNKLFFLFIICLGCLIGGVVGKFEVVSRTVSAAERFGEAWISYESRKLKEIDSSGVSEQPAQIDELTDEKPSEEPGGLGELDGKTEMNQAFEVNEPNGTVAVGNRSLSSEIMDFIEKSDYDVDVLRRIEISDSDLTQIMDLSLEEYEFVFFTGGEYVVGDWQNQEQINGEVLQKIEEIRGEGKINLFDDEIAPQYVQDEINNASEDEKSARSYMEIERIQQVRVDVYGNYPKKSIANLIANSEQLKALVLYYYRGRQQSILYHYGKSILWDCEYLKYEDVSDDEVTKRLAKIARRYEDIAFACKDCTEGEKAKKLQVAYENAVEQYRGVTDAEDR